MRTIKNTVPGTPDPDPRADPGDLMDFPGFVEQPIGRCLTLQTRLSMSCNGGVGRGDLLVEKKAALIESRCAGRSWTLKIICVDQNSLDILYSTVLYSMDI